MKKLLLLQALILTLSILCITGVNAAHTIDLGHTVRLHNNSDQHQTIEVYTRIQASAPIKYKEKQKLKPNHYVDLTFFPGEEVLFRIRNWTQDCQTTVDKENQFIDIVYTTDILKKAVHRMYRPFESVIPFTWQQDVENSKKDIV